MKKRRGLPGKCFEDSYQHLLAILIKYKGMKKKHMSKDRVVGIMYDALVQITKG